ncbi:VOC family protein [Streptomyces sp. NPDC090025]|uniref:VOC family protein n=1 Tax=Streptomyces sp. NPDC090025 TaxID=3365922 RepID=UPI003836844D
MLGTDFTTGSPDWLDLGTPDTGAAAAFYGRVFGWTLLPGGPDAGGYGFFQLGGRTVAALGPLTEEGATSAWTLYFQTSDADATTQAVEKGGGAVRVPPMVVMDAGRMAAYTDPAGAEFAVWEPDNVPGIEAASEVGTLLWAELHVPEPERTLGFYQGVFGWRWQEMDAPGMTYRVLSTAAGDLQDASFGGVAPLHPDIEKPLWIPYFHVADADATATAVTESGGSVLMPPADTPGVGRLAWFADPFGAPFAVLKPDPTM